MSVISPSRAAFAGALSDRGIHFGWVMAALAFLYALFSSAAMGVPGVLIVPMSKELGWSISELSAPLGLRLALFGLIAPFAGGLMLRHGPRCVVAWSGALLMVGLLLGILNGAVATGTLIFMPLAAWISELWGWRMALALPALGSLVCWLLFVWLS